MEILVRHNSVYVRNVNLGDHFSDLRVDVVVDRLGRVAVSPQSTPTKVSFYTDLDHLPAELLEAMSNRLTTEASNRILIKIEDRIRSVLDRKRMSNTEIHESLKE